MGETSPQGERKDKAKQSNREEKQEAAIN